MIDQFGAPAAVSLGGFLINNVATPILPRHWQRNPLIPRGGIDGEESHIRISQILTEVPSTGRLREKRKFLTDRGFDSICNC
jgi:hypothetical protein